MTLVTKFIKIEGFEEYLINPKGEVFSTKTNKLISLGKIRKGYMQVNLRKNNKNNRFYIHKVLAEAFIPNPENKPYINHIDGNPSNNSLDNLEWCTASENLKHSFNVLKRKPTWLGIRGELNPNSKKIIQYNKNMESIKIWENAYEVQRVLNILQKNICDVCNYKRKTAGKFIWRYG